MARSTAAVDGVSRSDPVAGSDPMLRGRRAPEEPPMRTDLCESDGMSIELDEKPGGVLVAHVHGALDVSTAPRLDRALRQRLDGAPARRVLLDLSDVQFLGCRGVSVLVRLARWAKAHTGCEPPCLIGLSSCGRRVLVLVEVIDMFSLHDTVESALGRG